MPCRVESLTRTRSLADRADGVPELAAAHRDLHEQEQGSCQTEKGIPRNKQRGPSAAYICICQRFRFAEAVRFRLLQIGVLRARCDFFLCIRRTRRFQGRQFSRTMRTKESDSFPLRQPRPLSQCEPTQYKRLLMDEDLHHLRSVRQCLSATHSLKERSASPPRCVPLRPSYNMLDAPKAPRRDTSILKPKCRRSFVDGDRLILLTWQKYSNDINILTESLAEDPPTLRDIHACPTSRSTYDEIKAINFFSL